MNRKASPTACRSLFLLFPLLLFACHSDDDQALSLAVSPEHLDFGLSEQSLPVELINTGGATLRWSMQSDEEWLSVHPAEGTISSNGQSRTAVEIERAGLAVGEYAGILFVSSNGGNAKITVRCEIQEAVPSESILYLLPDLTLSSNPYPLAGPLQRRILQETVEWVKDLGVQRISGTQYSFSISAASYTDTDLEVSLTLSQSGKVIPLAATAFAIRTSSPASHEALLTGPDPQSLSPGGRLTLTLATEGMVWIGLGTALQETSLIRVPIP